MGGSVQNLKHRERPVTNCDLAKPDGTCAGTKAVRAAVVVALENLRRDDKSLVAPAVTNQGMIGIHAGNTKEVSVLFGRRVVEAREALESLIDSNLSAQPPLGVDLGTIGFQSEHTSDEKVASVAGCELQAALGRRGNSQQDCHGQQGCTHDDPFEVALTAYRAIEKGEQLLTSRGSAVANLDPSLRSHDYGIPHLCTQSNAARPPGRPGT